MCIDMERKGLKGDVGIDHRLRRGKSLGALHNLDTVKYVKLPKNKWKR